MSFLTDPFFWAFLSMFGLAASSQTVTGKNLGKYPLFGMIVVAVFALGRIVLMLPSLSQPRFDLGLWNWIIGGIIFAAGIIFSIPAFAIRPFTAPNKKVQLQVTGFYHITRNPIYPAELLWCLG